MFDSGEHMWAWLMASNPIAGALTAGRTDEQCDELRQVLDRMLWERGGRRLPATLAAGINVATGTK